MRLLFVYFVAGQRATSYDPYRHDPRFCGIEYSLEYEMFAYLQHYHPSVSDYASHIVKVRLADDLIFMSLFTYSIIMFSFTEKTIFEMI